MLKNYQLLSFFLLLNIFSINAQTEYKKINVEFELNGKRIPLKDNFKIDLFFRDSIQMIHVVPIIKNNSLYLKKITKDSTCIIIFRYKRYMVVMTGFNLKRGNIDLTWVFGLDRKPFEKKHSNSKDARVIEYVEIESTLGDGFVLSGPIYKPFAYKKTIYKFMNRYNLNE